MKKLPLPSPRSPAQLDEEILAYAKQRAPSGKHYSRPAWIGGLAAVSVVTVAVLLVLPQQPDPVSPAMDLDVQLESTAERVVPEQFSSGNSATESARIGATATKLLRKEGSPMAARAGVAAMADEAASSAEVLAPPPQDLLQERLRELATLLESGDTKEAEAGYEALKNNCDSCKLPATLQEAIESFRVDN